MNKEGIKKYYNGGIEKGRLKMDIFKLEGLRTKEIIGRYLNAPQLNILDVGGGAGFYAFWLSSLGHSVSLVDLSPGNIALAKEYARQHGMALTTCEIGDAVNLVFPDSQFDIVLLLGPLYHLTEKDERVKALLEAKRVLKPGGVLIAAVISRYASLIDGLKRNLIADDQFEKILVQDLQTGVHVNHTDNPEYFTTAFFHTPSEIKEEVNSTGLKFEKLIAVESLGWAVDESNEQSGDEHYMSTTRKLINMVESNDDLVAISPHILTIAVKE